MKKLLTTLLFIPLVGFGQTGSPKKYHIIKPIDTFSYFSYSDTSLVIYKCPEDTIEGIIDHYVRVNGKYVPSLDEGYEVKNCWGLIGVYFYDGTKLDLDKYYKFIKKEDIQ